MEMRRIGALEVSVVGLGTNNFGFFMAAEDVPPVVDAALEAGITFFDTADSYGESEVHLGKALGDRRDHVVIATKFGSPVDGGAGGAARDYVRSAVERSLTRLGTDRIDLYQLHRPDPGTPIGDTLGVLDELVREGKVREIGCSNFSAGQLREAAAAVPSGAARFVSVQNQLNLLHREDEFDALPECERLGMAYLPYFPLASGLLSGKYARGEKAPPGSRLVHFGSDGGGLLSDRNFDVVDSLGRWAAERGHTLLELAVAWLASKRTVASVIAGATSRQQVLANVAAGEWRLTADEADQVDRLAPAPIE
jgi:aryl-alcohol dehydrogenase-like predicted oxidoreductase